jgi:hypothetical protein
LMNFHLKCWSCAYKLFEYSKWKGAIGIIFCLNIWFHLMIFLLSFLKII